MSNGHTIVYVARILLALLITATPAIHAAPRDIDRALLLSLVDRLAEPYESFDRFDAEVWLTASDQRLTKFVKTPEQRVHILQTVFREANHHGIDADLVLAVMQIESAFKPFAISRVGAQGLMQIMPFWRVEIGREQDNLTHIETNIRYGTAILAHYLDVAGGDLVDALGRYNGSRGRLRYPEKVIGAWRRQWRNKTSEELPDYLASCKSYALKACRYQ